MIRHGTDSSWICVPGGTITGNILIDGNAFVAKLYDSSTGHKERIPAATREAAQAEIIKYLSEVGAQ
jgi:hypothetical protein